MKKSLFSIEFFVEFFCILVFFVFPAFFPKENADTESKEIVIQFFSVRNFVFALFGAVLYYGRRKIFYPEIFSTEYDLQANQKSQDSKNIKKLALNFIFCFSGAVFSAVFFEFLALIFEKFLKFYSGASLFSGTQNAVIPAGTAECVLFLLSLASSAFYEECLYRFYIPEMLKTLCRKKFTFFTEFITASMFALGHFYLGIFAVLNAFVSGVIFRKCFLNTKNIFIPFLAHFFYNALAFLIFALFKKI